MNGSQPLEILPPREFGPITTQMFVRYAGASGDFNPIHFDKDFATSAGYPGVFSQGMHHAALLSTYLTDWSGAAAVRRFQVSFKDQVWPGDILTCSGEVTGLELLDGHSIATVSLTLARADTVVLAGQAEVVRLTPSSE